MPPQVYSLGILLNNPGVGDHLVYTDEHRGQGVRFTFPVVELESWRTRWDELETLVPGNPFAVVIMAQLQANRYRDKRTRLKSKFELVRSLRRYGYTPETASEIYRLIEWMIALPEDLEPEYRRVVSALSEESKMTYVTLIEREGIKRGRVEGRTEGRVEGRAEGKADLLLNMIQRRFGAPPAAVVERIRTPAPEPHLSSWALNILDADALDDVFRGESRHGRGRSGPSGSGRLPLISAATTAIPSRALVRRPLSGLPPSFSRYLRPLDNCS